MHANILTAIKCIIHEFGQLTANHIFSNIVDLSLIKQAKKLKMILLIISVCMHFYSIFTLILKKQKNL